MQAKRLPPGGTIGIICPSHVAEAQRYAPIAAAIKRLGFVVKFGANIQKDTYVYTDDFGHGTRHAILPIGANACLDADNQKMFMEFGGQK